MCNAKDQLTTRKLSQIWCKNYLIMKPDSSASSFWIWVTSSSLITSRSEQGEDSGSGATPHAFVGVLLGNIELDVVLSIGEWWITT